MAENPVAVLTDLIYKQKERFSTLDLANGRVLDFTQECLFARQQLLKNNFTLETAARNPNSLQAAILNVAAIGVSLNPALAHAYLVPRDGAICLDISFRGLAKIATESGAIKLARVELVYAADRFVWNGPFALPTHEADPFVSSADRGEMKGGYCIAVLPDGSHLVETMPAEQIWKIRDTSKAAQKGKGPWLDWPEEMAKKTILKRAAKNWPQSPQRTRVDTAVAVLHETEGTAYSIDQHSEYMGLIQSKDAVGLCLMHDQLRQTSTGEQTWIALFGSFAPGQKVANKKRVNDLVNLGRETVQGWALNLTAAAEADDDRGVAEILESLTEAQHEAVNRMLSTETLSRIAEIAKRAA